MPFFTIVSAVSRRSTSLILVAKVFQVLKPIGGVRARPSNFWAKAGTARHSRRQRIFFMGKEFRRGRGSRKRRLSTKRSGLSNFCFLLFQRRRQINSINNSRILNAVQNGPCTDAPARNSHK